MLESTRRHTLWLLLALAGCGSGTQDAIARLDAADTETDDRITALERSRDAAYDREKAMAARLRRMEETVALLQAGAEAVNEPREQALATERPATDAVAAPYDAAAAYSAAYALHQQHQFEAAAAAFAAIVDKAPRHALADNAQYWAGEGLYALGRYRQALSAFTAVLASAATEKDDDAQLMIARTYSALGEKEKAVTAFRKLLTQFPDSEYVDAAMKDLGYLEGP